MPTFDYKCPNCKRVYEFYWATSAQAMEAGRPTCPGCQHDPPKLIKVPSTSSFVIKGFSEKNGYSK